MKTKPLSSILNILSSTSSISNFENPTLISTTTIDHDNTSTITNSLELENSTIISTLVSPLSSRVETNEETKIASTLSSTLETKEKTTIASTSNGTIISSTHYLTTPSKSTKIDTKINTDSKNMKSNLICYGPESNERCVGNGKRK
jgi:hypothetical protein